jgi:hypothetical protein
MSEELILNCILATIAILLFLLLIARIIVKVKGGFYGIREQDSIKKYEKRSWPN